MRGQARAAIAEWVADHKRERPHSALGYQTPASFAEQLIIATVNPGEKLASGIGQVV